MLWMVAVAVQMTLLQAQSASQLSSFNAIWSTSFLIPTSIAVATLMLGCYWWWKGRPFFSEVGHWLLLILAVDFFIYGVLVSAVYLASGDSFAYHQWIDNLMVAMKLSASLFAGYLIAETKIWKSFFFVLAASYALSFLHQFLVFLVHVNISQGYMQHVYTLVFYCLSLIPLMLCVLGIREQLRDDRSRHWSHWVGVMCWLFMTVLSFAQAIYYQFFWSGWSAYPPSGS